MSSRTYVEHRKSEGESVNVRPFIAKKKSKKDIDEASDVYNTAKWLIRNIKNNNGNIDIIGSLAFTPSWGALSGHPAIKATVPKAPVTDCFFWKMTTTTTEHSYYATGFVFAHR